MMAQRLVHVAVLVREYDEALAFYRGVLGFELQQDTPQGNKRWVTVRPPGGGAAILLARADGPVQEAAIGNQSGGRVFLFLATDDFARDHARYQAAGVQFVRPPTMQDYGTVAVFADLYGNLWDLIEFTPGHPMA